MSATTVFSAVFVGALLAKWALLLWLSWRQQRSTLASPPSPPAAFGNSIGVAEHQKAGHYTAAKQNLARWSISVGMVMTLLWTVGGGLAWLDALALEISGPTPGGLMHGLVTVGAFVLVGAIVGLPLSVYSTFVVEERFGFNRTRPGLFVADLIRSFGLSVLLGGAMVGAILWLMQAMQDTAWWLWAWCFIVAWNLILIAIWPRWLAPMFNRFTPLPDGDLRERIKALLKRCGFHAGSVYVMDGSKRSAHGNAYFTGLGRNKRVVFFDTLIETLTPEQTEAVLAHELGHSALKHIPKRIIASIALWLPALWLLDQLLHAEWFFAAFGLSPANHLALLLFILVLPAFVFFIQPMMNYFSRKHEFEADAYAVAHSDRESLVGALVRLYKDNAVALNPDPWYSVWHDSHPAPLQRIARIQSTPAP